VFTFFGAQPNSRTDTGRGPLEPAPSSFSDSRLNVQKGPAARRPSLRFLDPLASGMPEYWMGARGSKGVPSAEGPAAPQEAPRSGDDPVRVLIVEDHRVVAEGLAALINSQADMKVVGNVGTVGETAPAATELNP